MTVLYKSNFAQSFLGLVISLVLGSILLATSADTAVKKEFDLRDVKVVTILGEEPGDGAQGTGRAGDVNGDGLPDLLVSGSESFGEGPGFVYVLFGPFKREERIRLGESGLRGFEIRGAKPGDFANAAAAAGDVNNDGLDDVIVGASFADTQTWSQAGRAYVVFGKETTDPVELGSFDTNTQGDLGFRIDGPRDGARVGQFVDGLRDLNGDGFDDFLIGTSHSQSDYVVFGKVDNQPVDLTLFDLDLQGLKGYRVDHPVPLASGGLTSGRAGDVNGDGLMDLLIGFARREDDTGKEDFGKAWIVWGKSSANPEDVRADNLNGFMIQGGEMSYIAEDADDVNRDGLADVIIGSDYGAKPFVVFGKRGRSGVSLWNLGSHGFVIKAESRTVSGAGDVNGDQLADLSVSDSFASPEGRPGAGSVWIVFGKRSRTPVKLSDLPRRRGYRIDGQHGCNGCTGDQIEARRGADFNEDGQTDILISASGVKRDFAGKVHIFWGRP